MRILDRIINFFTSGKQDDIDKLKKLIEEESLVKSEINMLTDEFQEFNSLLQRVQKGDNEFLKAKVQEKFDNFLSSHVKNVADLKKKRDKVIIARDKLIKSEPLHNAYKLIKARQKFDDGVIGLDVFDTIVKAVTKQKVRYSDIIVINTEGEILLLQRANTDEFAGKWVIPGGHVDPGEDFETAAKRELEEESGLRVTDKDDWEEKGVYTNDKVDIHYFHLTLGENQQLVLDNDEHHDYKWVPISDMKDYPMVFNMKENVLDLLMPIRTKVRKLVDKVNKGELDKNSLHFVSKSLIKGNERDDKILKSLYSELEDEFLRLQESRDFLLKANVDHLYIDKVDDIIEKAKKDISKLNKVKRFVVRDGKTFLQTTYVKTGEREEEEHHKHLAWLEKVKDIKTGEDLLFKTKKGDVHGKFVTIGIDHKRNIDWVGYLDEENNMRWISSNTILGVEKKGTGEDEYINGYKFVKNLGGSTGAELVEDKFGNKYVKKTGKDKEHIHAEYQALKLYDLFDVKVPLVGEYDKENGVLYTQYLDKTLPINPNSPFTREKISHDFVVDALLANWDVVGMEHDNILQTEYGFYRVDVGGSLNKRAQGEDKEFGAEVKEIDTLLDPGVNNQTATIFSGVKDVNGQIVTFINNWDSKYKDKLDENSLIDDNIKSIIKQRVENLRGRVAEYVNAKTQEQKKLVDKINYDGNLYDIDEEYYGTKVKEFYDRINQDMRVTEDDVQFLLGDNYTHHLTGFLGTAKSEEYEGDFTAFMEEVKKFGVTDYELYAIIEYTGEAFGKINEILANYTSSLTGNVSFDEHEFKKEKQSVKTLTTGVDFLFDPLLDFAKNVNYHHQMGDTNYNEDKKKKFDESAVKIFQLFEDIKKNPSQYTKAEKEAIKDLNGWASEITVKLGSTLTINQIQKPDVFSEIQSSGFEGGQLIKIKGNKLHDFDGDYSKRRFIEGKLLLNGLRKLEQSRNPKVLKKGVCARNFYLYEGEFSTFVDEHKKREGYITYTRGQSSTKGLESKFGGNIRMKIHGQGVLINAISANKGSEYEVLHKPFSLYQIADYQKDAQNYFHLVLDKIE